MPSLLAQALWPFPAPHLGLAEGHWRSPGSKILGLAQGGLSCSFKLWGSVHRPPIVLGSSLVPTLPSALGSHTSSLSTYMDKPRRHHSSFFIAACPMDHHASVLRAICSGAGCKAGPVANQQKKAYAWRLQGCPCHEDLDKLLA